MRFFTLSTLVFVPFFLGAQVTNNLEAYYSFDNCQAVDDSGNGADGALIGNPECVCGLGLQAIRFNDPTNDDQEIFFPVGVNEVFSTSDFTVSFYIHPKKNAGASQLIMSKQDNCNSLRQFNIRYNANSNSRKISSTIRENDTLVTTVTGTLDADVCWQHIVLARSNTRYSLYINGRLADTRTADARIDLTSPGAILKIARPNCPTDKGYQGDFDELRVYSRALDPEQIATLDRQADRILNSDTLIYLGNSLQVRTDQSCASSFNWTPQDGSVSPDSILEPMITPTVTTDYVLQFNYDFSGCVGTDTLHVQVIDPDTLDCTQIFIPNAFTPGGSPNRNDRFGISNPFSVQQFISFEIFDRWGGRMFAASSPFDTWDGTVQGQPVNPGVFLYRLYYECNGEKLVKAGSLTLIR